MRNARQRNGSLLHAKKATLLTPEEQSADEERRAKRRAWQKQWREKKKDSSYYVIHQFLIQLSALLSAYVADDRYHCLSVLT